VDDAPAVISELEKIHSAFERAQTNGAKFSFLIEDMGGTSRLVWERRKICVKTFDSLTEQEVLALAIHA